MSSSSELTPELISGIAAGARLKRTGQSRPGLSGEKLQGFHPCQAMPCLGATRSDYLLTSAHVTVLAPLRSAPRKDFQRSHFGRVNSASSQVSASIVQH
jgi:hypothetical protein